MNRPYVLLLKPMAQKQRVWYFLRWSEISHLISVNSNLQYFFSLLISHLRDHWPTIVLLHHRLQMWPTILWFPSKIGILDYIFIRANQFQADQSFPAFCHLGESSRGQIAGWDSDLVLGVCIQPSHSAWDSCRCLQIFLSYHGSQPFQKGPPDIADSCWNYTWPSLIPLAENKVL